MLEHAWIGISEFRETEIEKENDHDVDNIGASTMADRASEEGSDAAASQNTAAGVRRKGQPDP